MIRVVERCKIRLKLLTSLFNFESIVAAYFNICIRIDLSSAHVNFDVFTSKRTLGHLCHTSNWILKQENC